MKKALLHPSIMNQGHTVHTSEVIDNELEKDRQNRQINNQNSYQNIKVLIDIQIDGQDNYNS